MHAEKQVARGHLKPGGALFAVDICEGGPKGFFAADSASDFVAWFLRLPDSLQMHYEIIPDGVPIKLYFDVEYLLADNAGLAMDAVIAQINSSVQQALRLPDLQPFQTDASNAKKASRHLAYPVVLADKVHVKSLVQHVLADLRQSGTAPVTAAKKGQVCGIDEGVYDKERNFRLCYAHKWGQPERKLLPVGPVASKLEAVQRAMISHFLDELPLVPWHCRPSDGWSSGGGTKRAKHHVASTGLRPGDESKLDAIRAFARTTWPESNIAGSGGRFRNMLQIALKPGVFCPHAKRVHKSNCTWFNVELPDGKGHLRCADPECQASSQWGRFRVEL